MQRRQLIKRGLLGGVLLALGGGAFLGTRKGDLVAPPGELGVLDAHAYSVLVALAAVVIPKGADAKQAAFNVDNSLRNASLRSQRDMNEVLHLLDNALLGLPLRGSATVFTQMSPADRVVAFQKWRDSKLTLLRGAYHSLRKLSLAGHYADLEHAKSIGYPGPHFDKPDPGPITARGPLSPPWTPSTFPPPPPPRSPEPAAPDAPAPAPEGSQP